MDSSSQLKPRLQAAEAYQNDKFEVHMVEVSGTYL